MELRYEEWRPAARHLKNVVTAYWHVTGDPSKVSSPAILPDGHVELVFNFGDPVGLTGPAYTGDQPARTVVGILASTVKIEYRGPVNTFGIRFHPARGAAFFRQRATALTNRLRPLMEVSRTIDAAFSKLLEGGWRPDHETSRAALDQMLLDQLAASSPVDAAVVAITDELTRGEPLTTVAEMAREIRLSSRQVQRRFVAAVGIPPKQFVRVIRFARLWQAASMQPPDTWAALAAEYGYADQAHMVREFRAFGADPPSHLFSPDWYGSTTLSRVPGPSEEDVRSVQDAILKRR